MNVKSVMPSRKSGAAERPRERLSSRGAAALTDAELLALVLGSGTRGLTALELAQAALETRGGLSRLLDEGAKRPPRGFGSARCARLVAGVEIARRAARETLERRHALTSPDAVRAYLQLLLAPHGHEVFAALFLDSQHRLIAAEELFHGTLAQTSVYPREVVKRALAHNAAAVIFAHNHPSGVAEPSRADELLTHSLKAALALVDVRTLDHFIVGAGAVVSLAERGMV